MFEIPLEVAACTLGLIGGTPLAQASRKGVRGLRGWKEFCQIDRYLTSAMLADILLRDCKSKSTNRYAGRGIQYLRLHPSTGGYDKLLAAVSQQMRCRSLLLMLCALYTVWHKVMLSFKLVEK